MLCPVCHTQNRDNAKFCKGCGQLLAVEVVASPQPGAMESSDQTQSAQAQQLSGSPSAPEESIQSDTVASATPAPEQEIEQSDERSYVPTPEIHEREVPVQATMYQQAQAESAATPPEGEDTESGPTQILTPQQMLAFHARRWQQDREREQQDQVPHPDYDDIANAPTLLMTPDGQMIDHTQASDSASSAEQASNQVTSAPASQSPAAEQSHPATESDAASAQVDAIADIQEPEQGSENFQRHEEDAIPQTDVSAPVTEEEQMEPTPGNDQTSTPIPSDPYTDANEQSDQTTSSASEQTPESTDNDFPVLEVGTTLGDRYEVTQVLNAADQEHVYEVADRKGYLHCWNCGSDENGEGDEFCIDCGAELLNASYILHEYSQSSVQESDAQVLHGAIVTTFVEHSNTYVVEQPVATQSAFPNGVHLIAASDSDAGNVRRAETNEDSTLVLQFERIHESISAPIGLYVVADGMGGHANGQGASRATIGLIAERVVREQLHSSLHAEKSGEAVPSYNDEDIKELLREAIEEANTSLCQTNQQEKSDMGSTLTGFMVVGDRAYIFNVGDSRTYMLRDEKLYQLTNDHSLVGQLVAGGLIEPEDVYTHPQRNQIFRNIGDKQNVQVDLFTQQIHPGDILISCSDGLWEMVRDPQLADILNQAPDPQTACTQLIEAANTNGGEDNVSAVIVYVR